MNESKSVSDKILHQPTNYEPIHLPESIQPHGVLLAIDEADFSILQVSNNTEEFLGFEPQQLLGKPLETIFDNFHMGIIRKCLPQVQERVIPIKLSVKTIKGLTYFDSSIHRTNTAEILEMESTTSATQESFLSIDVLVREVIAKIKCAKTSTELLTIVVNEIQNLTNFDRVLVYQFYQDGAGKVIAEAKHSNLLTYLGLHFPAHDIPELFRELYTKGKIRAIPNIQAVPVLLTPPLHPKTGQPLDLNLSVLRSLDPCCVEYYQNMNTSATLVASLIKDQKLWGLIACHHPTPKRLPYGVKAACEIIAQMTSSELGNKIRQEDLNQRSKLNTLQSELIASISQADNFIDALIQPQTRLLNLIEASGAAICLENELTLIGQTPTLEQIRSLIEWVSNKIEDNLFYTNCLSREYPEADTFKAKASGLLVLQISQVQHYFILWFRPEVLQTINWGGKPDKVIRVDENGELRLCPRKSFELWQQIVRGTSLPWQSFAIESVLDLRNAIVGIVLKGADDLAKLNRELEYSNRELGSFAHAAAHDLKEPLRGIYNYANILLEDYAQVLDQEGMEYLSEIQGFTQRMETLISALLRIAQLRQIKLQLQTIDLNKLLEKTVEVVRASWPELVFELRIPKLLPQIQCDPTLVNEVFRNLISNAVKYNDRLEKWVEVGYQEVSHKSSDRSGEKGKSSWVFYIQDNGIGIREEHLSKVFKLFKRLHPPELYGGGAGVGLAIVNQIVERHGGRIWVESTPGGGSTFYFSLEAASRILN